MTTIDFLASIYECEHTRDSLIRDMDGVLSAHKVAARALPFYCEVPVADWMKRSSLSRRLVSHVGSGDGVHQFRCELPSDDGEAGTQRREGRFFIYDHPDYPHVHVLLTLEPTVFFDWLRRLVEKSFPSVVTTFITHRTLRRLLEAFQTSHSLSRLIIRRASFRIRFGEHHEGQRGRVIPGVSWPDWELNEAFEWVYQQNGWFQSLQFDACRDHRVLASISFTRQGITRTTGLFSQIFAGFVDPVCKRIHENVEFLGQRSRRERTNLSARPLVIDFETEQIAEDDERQRFVRAMKALSRASVSVLHGNPYVHLSVLDYYDGSVFDVWVLSGREITIVPQIKGTMPALKRLIHHVFDSYAEGRLVDYAGDQP
jgi:hypothetical protein